MLFHMPNFQPQLTFGPWHPQSGWEPGPSGPLPDPRSSMFNIGPFYGRAVQPLNLWGPNLNIINLFPQMPVNNRYATQILDTYVPGWLKQPPTPRSGF